MHEYLPWKNTCNLCSLRNGCYIKTPSLDFDAFHQWTIFITWKHISSTFVVKPIKNLGGISKSKYIHEKLQTPTDNAHDNVSICNPIYFCWNLAFRFILKKKTLSISITVKGYLFRHNNNNYPKFYGITMTQLSITHSFFCPRNLNHKHYNIPFKHRSSIKKRNCITYECQNMLPEREYVGSEPICYWHMAKFS